MNTHISQYEKKNHDMNTIKIISTFVYLSDEFRKSEIEA